jgi:hypothetical protein
MVTSFLSQIRDTPKLEGKVPVFLSPRSRVAVMTPGTWFHFRRILLLAWLQWRWYEPGSTPWRAICYALTHKFEADRIRNTALNSASTSCVRIRCCAGMNWSSRGSCYDRSVCQCAPERSTHLGPTTRLPPLSVTGLPMRGDRLDERMGPSRTLGSESRGTRDHIPLSQIREFPFRRLPPLEGSRWSHSTPPPHEITNIYFFFSYRTCVWH